MKKELLACTAVLFTVTTAASFQPPPRVPTTKVKDFPGQPVTVCGKVVTYDCDEKKDRTTVLHLDAPYWSNEVGILIPGTARDQFGPGLEGRYTLGTVCATGVVERRDLRDIIRVEDPAQISVEKKPPASPFPADAVRPCDRGVTMPQVIREVKPSYTADAMRAQQQGLVLVETVVLADGTVGKARVLAGFPHDFGLDNEALRAVRQWRFRPGTVGGKPVPVVIAIELLFQLKYSANTAPRVWHP